MSGKLSAAVALALAVAVSPALAQKAAKAKVAPQKDAQSAWVKLCETAKLQKPVTSKDQKPEVVTKEICLTHHERLDGNSGIVLVSAAIRKVEGMDKERLLIMVPLGMAIPAGVQAKIDDDKTPIKLAYTLCHPGGCTAETEATKEIIEQLKKGKQMVVAAVNATGRPFFAGVPLNGFGKTHAGKPIDNKKYSEARKQLMVEIRRRQQENYEKMKAEAAAKQKAEPKK